MNIAFFCIPAHGHTNPTLAVVRELTARGHTVRYYTTEAFRAKVEAAGAVFVPFDAEAARPGMTAADGARLGSDLTFSTRLIVDLTLAADDWLSRELTVHRPDVIVGDSMAFWAKLAAKKHGIPLLAQMPIDPQLAALTDEGRIEEFKGDWLADAVTALEAR